MTGPLELLELLTRATNPTLRAEACAELARRAGASSAMLFTRDATTGALLPASGFPQTLRGGPLWKDFIRACNEAGLHKGEVDYPTPKTDATAIVTGDGTAIVFFGGSGLHLPGLVDALPLIGATLRQEKLALHAIGVAATERAAGMRANDLAAALEAARTKLQDAVAKTAALNDELREAHRRKDEFLAMLGHELRNPLAAATTAIALLREHSGDPSQVQRVAQVTERQLEQLARLVNDLLDVARITTGKITLQATPQDIIAIAKRSIESVKPLVESRRHALSCTLREPSWGVADPTRIEQILTNLLTNAVKYTPDGGRIAFEVCRAGPVIRSTVRDSGIGIAPEMIDRIFEPFVQVAPTFDRVTGGLGIGLALVERLARLHGGSVHVTSSVGAGSEFVFELPACDVTAVVAPDRAPPSVSVRRVLVVDDNVDAVDMMCVLLGDWGHQTSAAYDGVTALRIAMDTSPDVVLLDLGLPGLDGCEVARRLRANPRTAKATIIALSGFGMEADRRRTRDAGFDGHLTKPVDFEELRKLLGAD